MKTMLLALTLSGQAPAESPDWVHIYTARDGTRAFYEPASVVRGDDVVRVRFRALPGGKVGETVREFVATEELNCARRTTTTVALVAEMRTGQRTEVPLDGRSDAINADTPVGALFDIVCARAPSA